MDEHYDGELTCFGNITDDYHLMWNHRPLGKIMEAAQGRGDKTLSGLGVMTVGGMERQNFIRAMAPDSEME